MFFFYMPHMYILKYWNSPDLIIIVYKSEKKCQIPP